MDNNGKKAVLKIIHPLITADIYGKAVLNYPQILRGKPVARNDQGRFTQKPDSLGGPIGLRLRKNLEGDLNQLVEEYGIKKTVLCRALVEGLLQPNRANIVKEIIAAFKEENSTS